MSRNLHITIDNYENWFLLYADNELSEEQKQQVLQFVNDYPHLQFELENLLAAINISDEEIVFAKKKNLLKKINNDDITDEAIILFLDGEADDSTAKKIRENTSYELQKRMNQLKNTYNVADISIVYHKKEKLYKRSNTVTIRYWLPRVAAAAAVLGFSFWMFENNIFQSSKNENPIVKNVPKTDSVFHKSSSETLATQAIAENEIKINQKENLINHQNKIIVAAKKLDEKRSIAKMPDSKLVVPERNFISRVDVFYQKTEQPKIISKTNIPTNIQKKEINSLLELSAPSLEEIVAISPRENEKKRNRFFKNLSEKIKEKSMAILSDDNENIIIAGFAVNVRK